MDDSTVIDIPVSGSTEPIAGRCGSPLRKKPGRYCVKARYQGGRRCELHGGKSLSGIASPTWKHGAYSKFLRGSLATDYKAARKNPDLVTHIDQIALIDARIFDVLRKLNEGESNAAWEQSNAATDRLDTAIETLMQAQRDKDVEAMRASLDEIRVSRDDLKAARQAASVYVRLWDELKSLFILRKKLVDSESRRRKDAQETLDKTKVLSIIDTVAKSVLRNVKDPRERQAIVNDMRMLMAGSGEAA